MPALLSPGQGAQRPGLLTGWLDLPGARDDVVRWSTLCDLDLIELGTAAPAEALRPTDITQPLLTVAALLSGRALLAGAAPDAVCGHSVGELPALALAGVLTDDEAVALAAARGRLMATASAEVPTGLAAVLGPTPGAAELADAGLETATVNGPGQVVVGGPVEALERFAPSTGARLRRLDVAGAFHTSAMAPARTGFAAVVGALAARDARCPVVANADGVALQDGPALLARLVAQLVTPVRFDLCLTALAGHDLVELAPAGTLTGIAKRAGTTVRPLVSTHDLGVPA